MGCGVSSGETDRQGVSEDTKTNAMFGGSVLPNTAELLRESRIPQADCVVPLLYIGNLAMANDKAKLTELGVKRIVNATTHKPTFPMSFAYETVQINDLQGVDISPHLVKTAQFISNSLNTGEVVFVHCEMGMSRSASFVVAYLLFHRGWSVRRAILQVKLARPVVRITKSFIFTLLDCEITKADTGELDVELLIEEDLGCTLEGSPRLVTARAIQLLFFPSTSLIKDNLASCGLLPDEWNTFKDKYLTGVSLDVLDAQQPPDVETIIDMLSTSPNVHNAYSGLKRQFSGFVSPFVK